MIDTRIMFDLSRCWNHQQKSIWDYFLVGPNADCTLLPLNIKASVGCANPLRINQAAKNAGLLVSSMTHHSADALLEQGIMTGSNNERTWCGITMNSGVVFWMTRR